MAISTLDFQCLTSSVFDIISAYNFCFYISDFDLSSSANCRRQDTVDYEYMTTRVQLAMDISTDLFSQSKIAQASFQPD